MAVADRLVKRLPEKDRILPVSVFRKTPDYRTVQHERIILLSDKISTIQFFIKTQGSHRSLIMLNKDFEVTLNKAKDNQLKEKPDQNKLGFGKTILRKILFAAV